MKENSIFNITVPLPIEWPGVFSLITVQSGNPTFEYVEINSTPSIRISGIGNCSLRADYKGNISIRPTLPSESNGTVKVYCNDTFDRNSERLEAEASYENMKWGGGSSHGIEGSLVKGWQYFKLHGDTWD